MTETIELNTCKKCGGEVAAGRTTCHNCGGATTSATSAESVEEFKDFTQAERDKLADKGAAMDDGSFPIRNGMDLRNAIQAIGRAKNPDAVRAHIIKRARALGMADMLPEGWSVTASVTPSVTERVEALEHAVGELARLEFGKMPPQFAANAKKKKDEAAAKEGGAADEKKLPPWLEKKTKK